MMVRRGDGDSHGEGDGDGDKEAKKDRPTTPAPITEVGDVSLSVGEDTPAIISHFLVSRFQQEVGDPPCELVLTPTAAVPFTQFANTATTATTATTTTMETEEALVEVESDSASGLTMGDDSALGAVGPRLSSPQPPLRRQPTPDEMARYAEVARQLNQVARQVENDYSSELDSLVDDLNLVSDVAYDAFAAVARSIIANGISWSRVLVLILFGWRVMKKVYQNWSTSSGILQQIFDYIIKFVVDHVLSWITSRGGWTDFLRNPPSTSSSSAGDSGIAPAAAASTGIAQITPGQAVGLATLGAFAVIAYFYFVKKN